MFNAGINTKCECDLGTSGVFCKGTMWKLVPSSFAGITTQIVPFLWLSTTNPSGMRMGAKCSSMLVRRRVFPGMWSDAPESKTTDGPKWITGNSLQQLGSVHSVVSTTGGCQELCCSCASDFAWTTSTKAILLEVVTASLVDTFFRLDFGLPFLALANHSAFLFLNVFCLLASVQSGQSFKWWGLPQLQCFMSAPSFFFVEIELADAFPFGSWLRLLFFSCLDRLKRQGSCAPLAEGTFCQWKGRASLCVFSQWRCALNGATGLNLPQRT